MAQGNNDRPDLSAVIERRKYLKGLGGIAGVAGLAGCSGGGGGDGGGQEDGEPTDTIEIVGGDDDEGTETETAASETETATVAPDAEPVANEYRAQWKAQNPENAHFNRYNPKGFGASAQHIRTDNLAIHDRDGNFYPLVAKEWNFPETIEAGSTIELVLRDDPPHTWHSGEPITARDLKTQLELQKVIGGQLWNWIEAASIAGDYTLELEVETPANEQILTGILLQRPVHASHAVYKKHLEAIQDASSDDAENEAKAELLERTIENQETVRKTSSGAFQYVDKTSTQVTFERYEDYVSPAMLEEFDYKNVNFEIPNFEKYTFLAMNEEDEIPFLRSKKVDGGYFIVSPDDMPSEYEMTVFFGTFGESISFNFQHETFGRQNVRQAITYLMEPLQTTISMNGEGIPRRVSERQVVKNYTALPLRQAREWIGEDLLEQFNRYPYEDNPKEKATELLEEEGFTKQDGQWIKPNGEEFSVTVPTPSWWRKSGRPTVSVLNQFGIDASLQVQENSAFFGDTLPNRNYGMAMNDFYGGAMRLRHPWWKYDGELKQQTVDGAQGKFGIPNEIEVPETVGDPSSDLRTVNIPERVTELGESIPMERQRELVRLLAWVWNQHVPNPGYRWWGPKQVVRVDNWQYPETDTRFFYPDLQKKAQVGEFRAKWESEV